MKVETLIIGSGVVATALAQRLLLKNPHASILILEAGTKVKMQDSAIWQDYIVSAKLPYTRYYDESYPERDHKGENVSLGKTTVPLRNARVFTYGGSTIHWGGWAFRLKPEDFNLFSNTGQGMDWPFGYDELEPYYNQAEWYIGVSGDSNDTTVPRSENYPFSAFPYTLEDQPIAEALNSLCIGYSHVPIARHGITNTTSTHAPCQTTGTCDYCPFGARYSANNFLSDMTTWNDYPNFQIKLNCVVDKIIMSSKHRASGAVFFDKENRKWTTVDADKVIIAAGTIESSKLLQRSTSEFWSDGLGNDYDLVGRHFITHPYFVFSGTMSTNPLDLQPEMNFPTLCTRHFDSKEEQAKGKFILVNPPSSPSVDLLSKMQSGNSREDIDNYVKGNNEIQLHGMVEIVGNFKDRVTNFNRINHMGMIETAIDFSQADGFDQRMQEIQGHVKRIFDSMSATLSGKPNISWRADHAACTCRMSDDEKSGVVNSNLQIHGVDNVYICSTAVFPSSGAINPTLTLTALALRLGDYLNGTSAYHNCEHSK